MSWKAWIVAPLIWLVPAGLCFGALWEHPYSYYEWLRFVVGIAAGMFAIMELFSADDRYKFWGWAFAVTAVAFNPWIPIHMSRDVWVPIDVAVGVLFIAHMVRAIRMEIRGPR